MIFRLHRLMIFRVRWLIDNYVVGEELFDM